MNEDTFNMSIRKFLKTVGVRSQHEIEQCITKALDSKKLKGDEKLPVKMVLTIDDVQLNVIFEDQINLE